MEANMFQVFLFQFHCVSQRVELNQLTMLNLILPWIVQFFYWNTDYIRHRISFKNNKRTNCKIFIKFLLNFFELNYFDTSSPHPQFSSLRASPHGIRIGHLGIVLYYTTLAHTDKENLFIKIMIDSISRF